MRASLRCPTTELGVPHGDRWPSKRTSFRASPFVTYTFPDIGLTAMLNRIVPTPANGCPVCGALGLAAGGFVPESIRKTSSSGSQKRTAWSQLRGGATWSSQWPLTALNLTTSPVSGPVTLSALLFGAGSPPGSVASPLGGVHAAAPAPPLHTAPSETVVVRFPEWNTAAYTVPSSGLAASARGVSPKSVTIESGFPPSVGVAP